MADESALSTSTQAASPAAQVADAVTSAPVVEASAVQAVAPEPTAPSAVEAPIVTESAPALDNATTVLGAEPASAEIIPLKDEKPADGTEGAKPADGEVKKDEAGQSVEPAPLPTYEAFTLPEDVTVDADRLGEFTKVLGEFESLTKADHAEVQKLGQSLVDRHIAEVKSTIERLNESYINSWNKQKNDWKDAFLNDPEIGGNRQETTVRSALEFIRTHGGSEEQQAEFRNLMESTGVGNHPTMIRMLANANNALREGRPIPAQKPITAATSKVEKRYGKI